MLTQTDTATFLRLLYGDDAPGYLAIWTPDRFTRWFAARDVDRIATTARNLAGTRDVYYGLGLQPAALGVHQRGGARNVSAIPGVWIEIDYLHPAHKARNLPPSLEAAREIAEIFPLSYSVLVHSAHGLHVYWLFRELWTFEGNEDRAQAATLLRRFQKTIRGYAGIKGWQIDSTADLARVLRVPGTFNHKEPPPVPVEVLFVDDTRRYNPSDFEEFLAEDDPPPAREPDEDGELYLGNLEPIIEGCAWLRHCRDDAATLGEPEWYAMLSIVGRCEGGENVAHEWSQPHSGYSPEETFTKLRHAVEASKPRTCQNIALNFGDAYCRTCHQWGKIGSPSALGDPPGPRVVLTQEPQEWLPPTPFFQPDVPTFPLETLPLWLREYVEAEATFTQTPVDMAAMLSLAGIAAACQKKFVVEARDGWHEPVNLFTVCIMPPANRKTAVLASIIKPIEDWERDETAQVQAAILRAKMQKELAEDRQAKARTQATKAQGTDAEAAIMEAVAQALEVASIRIPSNPRLVADDATPEKLSSLLAEHDGRMAVFSAEGDVFDLMAGRYGNGANFGVFQKGHSGETLRVDRIHRAPEYIPGPALTLGLAVQPDIIRGLIAQPSFRGRGLLGRFLYVWPESLLGRREITPAPVPGRVYLEYCTQMTNLLRFKSDLDDQGQNRAHTLRLSRDACAALVEFMAWIEPQLGEMGTLHCIEDWAGKLAGAVVRIAGLLHLADHARDSLPWTLPVTARAVERAITIGRYLIPHALMAFSEMGADEDAERAKFILRWIEKTGSTSFSKRDVHQGTRGTFKRIEAIEAPLNLLVEHGYIRKQTRDQQEIKPGRKASPIYDVNPYVAPDRGL
jgi:hypothetical protein